MGVTHYPTKMLYQLPNGKCIEISVEQYLRMSDEELDLYVAYNIGEEVNDPFALSVLKYGSAIENDDAFDELITETLIEESVEDLTDILPEEKLYDEDFFDSEELEQ